jgi:putative hemolysin
MDTRKFLVLFCLLLVGCAQATAEPEKGSSLATATPQPTLAGLPNPASVYCEQQGYKLDIRTAADDSQSGVCIFPDGSECDEWAYFRGECKPGGAPATSEPTASPVAVSPTPTTAGKFASDGWKIYRNEKLGYSFHYPADATISTAGDPTKTLTIEGPLAENNNWPVIYVSYPSDREDYRPPDGIDLGQWLIDHNLLVPDGQPPDRAEVRQPDVQIAGTIAIHVRLARSPQTYAYDKYFFAKSGQLYVVTILHAGDKEDWELYNHFLESIQFEQ